ncbi:MAG: DUF3397 family protein [Candidatus Carbobacillus altaicus]|nr:DUF3397 family protein [Candidatus Carbobacillus altaicus]
MDQERMPFVIGVAWQGVWQGEGVDHNGMILKPIQWIITFFIAFPFLVAPLVYAGLRFFKRTQKESIYWSGAWTTLFFLLSVVHLLRITDTSMIVLWGSVLLAVLLTAGIGWLQLRKRGKLLREKLINAFFIFLLLFFLIDYLFLVWYGIVKRLPLV